MILLREVQGERESFMEVQGLCVRVCLQSVLEFDFVVLRCACVHVFTVRLSLLHACGLWRCRGHEHDTLLLTVY